MLLKVGPSPTVSNGGIAPYAACRLCFVKRGSGLHHLSHPPVAVDITFCMSKAVLDVGDPAARQHH